MASIQKHGDKWRVFYYRNGIRKTKVCRTKTEAREWAESIGVEVRSGEHGASDVMLHWAFDRYARDVCVLHKGKRWEEVRLNKIKREIKDKPLQDVSQADITKWRDDKTISPASILREMKLLNSFFEHCRKDWGYIQKNPMTDVKRPSSPPPRRRGVTEDEIEAVCKGLNFADDIPIVTKTQEVAVAFLLAIESGMRLGEMLSLTDDRIHLDRRFVELEETKNGDRRHVPLSKRAVQLIQMLPKKRFTVKERSADIFFRRARPVGLHFHDSRSEGITRLAKKLDVLDLARAIGHRDPKSLMLYYSESAEDIAKKLD